MEIPNCPHCRTTNNTFMNSIAQGTAIMWFDANGKNYETDIDRTWFKPSKTVRCENCEKIRQDLYLDMDSGIRLV